MIASALCLTLCSALNAQVSSSSSSTQPSSITGQVVNANTSQPISRALVRLGSQAILTGPDGHFEFYIDAGSSNTIQVVKPGYYDGVDLNRSGKLIDSSAASVPVTVYLYPETLLTGTVRSPDGDPLQAISIQAMRRIDDETGRRWMTVGHTSSNSDGEFRMALPPGDYLVETNYAPDLPSLHQAALPVIFPAPGAGGDPGSQSTMHLESGSERSLDLRPPLHKSYGVHLRFEGTSRDGYPSLEAHMSNGLGFSPQMKPTNTPGEMIATLPSGSYLITASTANRENRSYGQTRVTVTDQDVQGVVMQMTKGLSETVELAVDASSSTSDNVAPNIRQLGMYFMPNDHSVAMNGMMSQNVYPTVHGNDPPSFDLLPGSYRLRSATGAQWFVLSATVNGTDLLSQDLDVDSAGTTSPIQVVISNRGAQAQGAIRIADHPGRAWVYLLAETPSATPVIALQSGQDGSFTHANLPPGNYRAISFESHFLHDLSDPAALGKFATYQKSFSVAAGETANLALDAVPASELKP